MTVWQPHNTNYKNIVAQKCRCKSIRNQLFPCGPPPQYWVGPRKLNFRVRMGSGVSNLVWPYDNCTTTQTIKIFCKWNYNLGLQSLMPLSPLISVFIFNNFGTSTRLQILTTPMRSRWQGIGYSSQPAISHHQFSLHAVGYCPWAKMTSAA